MLKALFQLGMHLTTVNLFEHWDCVRVCVEAVGTHLMRRRNLLFFSLQLFYFVFLSAVSTTIGHTEVVNKLDECETSAWIVSKERKRLSPRFYHK